MSLSKQAFKNLMIEISNLDDKKIKEIIISLKNKQQLTNTLIQNIIDNTKNGYNVVLDVLENYNRLANSVTSESDEVEEMSSKNYSPVTLFKNNNSNNKLKDILETTEMSPIKDKQSLGKFLNSTSSENNLNESTTSVFNGGLSESFSATSVFNGGLSESFSATSVFNGGLSETSTDNKDNLNTIKIDSKIINQLDSNTEDKNEVLNLSDSSTEDKPKNEESPDKLFNNLSEDKDTNKQPHSNNTLLIDTEELLSRLLEVTNN